jgi:hypothetical protein
VTETVGLELHLTFAVMLIMVGIKLGRRMTWDTQNVMRTGWGAEACGGPSSCATQRGEGTDHIMCAVALWSRLHRLALVEWGERALPVGAIVTVCAPWQDC